MPTGPHVSTTSQARIDLAEIAGYYGERSSQLEYRFLHCAKAAFEKLSEWPELGVRCPLDEPTLSTVRMWPMPQFPRLLIFYRSTPGALQVLRVLHASRRRPPLADLTS